MSIKTQLQAASKKLVQSDIQGTKCYFRRLSAMEVKNVQALEKDMSVCTFVSLSLVDENSVAVMTAEEIQQLDTVTVEELSAKALEVNQSAKKNSTNLINSPTS